MTLLTWWLKSMLDFLGRGRMEITTGTTVNTYFRQLIVFTRNIGKFETKSKTAVHQRTEAVIHKSEGMGGFQSSSSNESSRSMTSS